MTLNPNDPAWRAYVERERNRQALGWARLFADLKRDYAGEVKHSPVQWFDSVDALLSSI